MGNHRACTGTLLHVRVWSIPVRERRRETPRPCANGESPFTYFGAFAIGDIPVSGPRTLRSRTGLVRARVVTSTEVTMSGPPTLPEFHPNFTRISQ